MSNTSDKQKVIKNKLGLLKFAETLGNVSDACRVMGYSRDSFYRMKPPRSKLTWYPSFLGANCF